MRALFLPPALLLSLVLGCGTVDASATTGPDFDGGILEPDGNILPPPPLDAGGDDGTTLPPGDGGFCQGSGPLIPIPGAGTKCTGDIGPTTFLFAVCSCKDVSVSGALDTDSVVPGSTTTGNGGSIGTNGSLATNSSLHVRGSVWAASVSETPAVHVVQSGTIFGDVHAGATVQADQPLSIGGDLYVNGDANGTISCSNAYLPAANNAAGVTATGAITRQAVNVAPPCDCTDLLDISSIVSGFASTNDDGLVGLTPSSLATFPSSTVALPCGRYYFQGVGGPNPITLDIQGRAAIFIQGDFHAQNTLTLTLEAGAELDLFITGNLILNANANLGPSDSPARARIYVGGDTLTLSGNASVGANLYAPHATVQLASDFSMAGSLFVGGLQLSGKFTIHYDESILSTAGCATGGGSCTSCHQCSGATPACNAGTCVPCVTDSDCCAPLHCSQGRCYDEIP